MTGGRVIGPRRLLAQTYRLSLRARLLAGLIALIAVFLIVMGTVSTIVLGTLEQDQFNANLRLAGRQSVTELAASTDGYSAAFLGLRTGQVGEITANSPATAEMRDLLATMAGHRPAAIVASLEGRAARDVPFNLNLPGKPALRVTWREVPAVAAAASGVLPRENSVILVGRPTSALGSQVRGLIFAEIVTGAALLALLAVCGNWLIETGLAPLGKMARIADVISARGDLAERMPIPPDGDRHEAGKLGAAINTMLDRIQQSFADRLRSEEKVRQFAADASHEMRTPLTTIRGYAELYRQGAIGHAELPNAMRRIEQEAERMSRLVAELLELARLDRTSSLDLTEANLTELVEDAVADALAVEPDRPIRTVVPGMPVIITADEPRLRQVLANLLGNVLSHTPPGTPAMVVLRESDGGVLLEVSDEGPGMAEADAARAFDRFHRAPRTAAAGEGNGSGLGLSIVQAIAAAHGGHARLRSAPGAGTTVRVWIPERTQTAFTKRPSPHLPSSLRSGAPWPALGQPAAESEPAATRRA